MKAIPLTQGQVALVDDDLFEELNKFKWYADRAKNTFYAARTIYYPEQRRHKRYMHQDVFHLRALTIPRQVDHRDRNGLNNQFNNLRPATTSDQSRNQKKRRSNTSGFIGVCWDASRNRWRSFVTDYGKQKRLGRFTDPFSAAWVRDTYVRQHFSEFGLTNNLTDRRVANIPVLKDRRK